MPNATYKLVEIVGSSDESVDRAVQNAIERASTSLKGLGWFEVCQIRGRIADGAVSEFQVTLKVGFRLMRHDEVEAAKGARTGAEYNGGDPRPDWDEELL